MTTDVKDEKAANMDEQTKANEEIAKLAKEAEEKANELSKFKEPEKVDDDLIKKVVAERVEKELKEIKTKLDTAYKLRDDAQAKAEALEKRERDANIQRLNDEGKHKEAYELEKQELKLENEKLRKTNTELSRDSDVKAALASLEFRNEKAFDVAFKDIIGQLVQDGNGLWTHRSGVPIQDFINVYSKEESQSFLFKPKASSGAGTSSSRTPGTKSDDTSLFAKTQEEVLAMAAAGKFNK